MNGLGLCTELVRSAWEIVNGTVFGLLTVAQLCYIDGSLNGLGLCTELVNSAWDIVNGRVEGTLSDAQKRYIEGTSQGTELVHSAWDIANGRVEGTLSDAQKRYIDGSLKGLKETKTNNSRRAEVALLIREKRVDEATEEEREEHKKFVASGKKNKYNCNTWVIKSTVQDKVLEFGNL